MQQHNQWTKKDGVGYGDRQSIFEVSIMNIHKNRLVFTIDTGLLLDMFLGLFLKLSVIIFIHTEQNSAIHQLCWRRVYWKVGGLLVDGLVGKDDTKNKIKDKTNIDN